MFYNFIFILISFLLDGAIATYFPAVFGFESMYFVPCIGLSALVLTIRKMNFTDGILFTIISGLCFDLFYGDTVFLYTIIYLLIYFVVFIWSKQINESIVESVALCISTIFVKELMVYIYMLLSSHTSVSLQLFIQNRLFLTILINTIFVVILVLLAYVKDDFQARKDVRVRKEERLPWLH